MQFSCESCKTNLMIADEKVRGKRLVVRCKRCGAKISISDPALAAQKSAPPPAAVPKPTPGEVDHRPRDTDTESTRAMDSELLEKAVLASKRDEPLALDATNGAPKPASAPPPPASPVEPAVWFAMLAGKQTGPLTHAELGDKTAEGSVGPRTYLWKEGMPSWQRAKDLPELAPFFPPPEATPPPLPPPINAHPAVEPKPVEVRGGAPIDTPVPGDTRPIKVSVETEESTAVDSLPLGERVHQESVADELFSAEPTRSPEAPLTGDAVAKTDTPAAKAPRKVSQPREFMFERSTEKSRAPVLIALFVLAVAAALGAWLYLADHSEAPAEDGAAEKPPAEKPQAKAAPPPQKPPLQTGLTADQVRKKLDENKAALQGCIDEALKRDPNLRVGKIHIATTIAPSGQVTTAKIDKRTVNDSPLGTCLKRATTRIGFPAFAGEPFDVDIPIVVTAGD
jgi:predicted Zn finger-like uncharacterized protein